MRSSGRWRWIRPCGGALALALIACAQARPVDREEQGAPLEAMPDHPSVEGFVTPPATGVQLWYERFGSSTGTPVVFLNGSDANCRMWSDDFVAPFLAAGHPIIRYDARDNGRSEWLPWPEDFEVEGWTIADEPPYPMEAHVEDLIGLLDALGVQRAHLVGASMGGMIAQLTALNHAERVSSLVLISTTPSSSFDAELAPVDMKYFSVIADRWRTIGMLSMFRPFTDGLIASNLAETYLLFAHRPTPSQSSEVHQMIERMLAHAPHNPRSAQGFAVAASPSRLTRLPEVRAPTLVVHGEHDQMFAPVHGQRLADAISHAQLLVVADFGHAVPLTSLVPYIDEMLDTIAHPSRAD